ncbi:unnamed protein product [Microthlaspi erraticum]|uniref:Uncharacterized protein n=1 Tax=Microthlaspi erraticum TaxID=1685480 RepID=A0A6D2KHW4_9BRAS|nr:unnamed protein product [Microthlaspi erraticum]
MIHCLELIYWDTYCRIAFSAHPHSRRLLPLKIRNCCVRMMLLHLLRKMASREKKDQLIKAYKYQPVHATNKNLQPVEVLPLLPHFDRYDEHFVVANIKYATSYCRQTIVACSWYHSTMGLLAIWEGRSDEIEHFPVPSRVTMRRRSTVSVIEHKDSGVYSNSRVGASSSKMRRLANEEGLGRS